MIHRKTASSVPIIGIGCYLAGMIHDYSLLFSFVVAAASVGVGIWYLPNAETVAAAWNEETEFSTSARE